VLSVQAGVEAFNGRFDAAARLQQRVVRQAPLSAVDRGNLGHFLYSAGRTEEARAEFKAVLDLVPSPAASSIARDAAVGIARIDVAVGRIDSARRIAESIPEGLERDYCLALIEHASRDRAAADAALDRFRAGATEEQAYRLAEIHAFRGEFDAAFQWLSVGARALAAQPQIRSERNWEARTSPLLAQVRHDPRWQDWVAANP
jgi:tetratricopeptide (TPR) repeat protein